MRAGRFAGTGRFWRIRAGRFAPGTGGRSSVPSSGSLPADYTITSNAEWGTIPAGVLSGGGRVAVRALPADGVYTPVTITAAPSATLHFYAETAGSWPRVDTITLFATNNIKISGLQIEIDEWSTDLLGAIELRGRCTNTDIRENVIVGNYRGTVDYDLDVTSDTYPEYACILPVFDSGGVITSFTIHAANVGDLLADGTHNMIFGEGVTGAVGTFTVSGGTITGTTLTNGGTSGYNTSTGIGVRSKIITWTGQNRMVGYLNYGIKAYDGATEVENITIKDNVFRLFQSAVKYGSCTGGTALIEGNVMSKMYADYVSLKIDQDDYDLIIRWNFSTLPFSKPGDPGDPHADVVQLYMDDVDEDGGAPDNMTPVNWTGVSIYGNIHVDGNARGGVQGIITIDSPPDIFYEGIYVAWNFIASKQSLVGLQAGQIKNGIWWANAIIRFDHTDTTNNTDLYSVSIPRVSTSGAVGANLVGRNVWEYFTTNGDPEVDYTTYPNTVLGLLGATIPYTSVFADVTAAKGTIAEIMAAYAPKVAYSTQGPFHDQTKVNHATRTLDRSAEPSWMYFAAVTNQTAGATVTSEWARLIGGPDTVSVHANGDEYRFADDDAGTNATSWGTATTTEARGRYGQVRKAASSTPGATVTPTLTAGSTNNVFSITTAATLPDWKNRYGTDNAVTAGSNRQDTVDIGPPDDDRVVCIVTATGSNFIQNSGDVLLGGNTTTRQLGTNTSAFQVHTIAVGQAGGATSMTLQVNNTSAGIFARCWSEVYVIYPSGGSATPLDAKTASASGTSTATTAAITIAAGGYLIVFGGYNGSANPVVPTYSGTDTLDEDDDWVSENATPMWAGHVDVTESTTRTVTTPSNGTSASKTAIGVSWAAPA